MKASKTLLKSTIVILAQCLSMAASLQHSWGARLARQMQHQHAAGGLPRPSCCPILPAQRSSICNRQQSSRNVWTCASPGQQQDQAAAEPPELQQPQQQIQQQQQQQGSWLQQSFQDPPTWTAFAGTLFQQGALLGPLLDGIHSRVGLQVYDLSPITLGPLHTSLLVPPLLGTFYVVLGLLTIAADNNSPGPATAAAQQRASDANSVGFLALNFGALSAALALSATLYDSQQPASVIFASLAAVTALNWALFDRTKQGLALAALCGLGAPAAEVVLMAVTHCWHYPRADVAGVFVSWVPWCYAFYTPAVSNLARYLWATCRPPAEAISRR